MREQLKHLQLPEHAIAQVVSKNRNWAIVLTADLEYWLCTRYFYTKAVGSCTQTLLGLGFKPTEVIDIIQGSADAEQIKSKVAMLALAQEKLRPTAGIAMAKPLAENREALLDCLPEPPEDYDRVWHWWKLSLSWVERQALLLLRAPDLVGKVPRDQLEQHLMHQIWLWVREEMARRANSD